MNSHQDLQDEVRYLKKRYKELTLMHAQQVSYNEYLGTQINESVH